MPTPWISIVIPTLNEAPHLPRTLASLAGQAGDVPREVIVVDGGSTDATLAAARGADRILTAPTGRASQMNHGAAAARGEVLLFLHADTTLSADALTRVAAAMGPAGAGGVGGAMRLRIAGAGLGLRAVAWGVNARSRVLRLPYGDQGIFLRRRVFEMLGGYRDLPIMEDADLVRRARRVGRMVLLPSTATTAGRRWRANGVVRTTLCNWGAVGLFAAGVSPERIRRWYGRLLRDRTPGDTAAAEPRPLPAQTG